MPFKSKAQQRWAWANKEKLKSQGMDVEEWQEATGDKKLPEKVNKEASVSYIKQLSTLIKVSQQMQGFADLIKDPVMREKATTGIKPGYDTGVVGEKLRKLKEYNDSMGGAAKVAPRDWAPAPLKPLQPEETQRANLAPIKPLETPAPSAPMPAAASDSTIAKIGSALITKLAQAISEGKITNESPERTETKPAKPCKESAPGALMGKLVTCVKKTETK